MIKPVPVWINTKTTTQAVTESCLLLQVVIGCADAGTAWTLKIQDGSSPNPFVVVPAFTLAVPTADGKPIQLNFDYPLPMTGGIDIITAGTTAGTGGVTVWLIINDGT